MGYYISGNTKELGVDCESTIFIYNRDSGQLLEKIEANGDYTSSDIGSDVLCYVVCVNPSNNFNALILDRITPEEI
jgi:hypothetical protein